MACENSSSLELTNGTCSQTDERDELLALFEISVLAAIFVVTVIGNTLLLYILFTKRKNFQRMNYFILALCISDLITAFFNVLPQLFWDITFRFKGGNAVCKLVKYGQLVGPYMNAYIMVVTAYDRFQVICQPLSTCSWRGKDSMKLILFAVFLALLFSTPQVFIFNYRAKNNIYDCWANFSSNMAAKAYVTWYAVATFVLPLILIIGLSVCIWWQLWRHSVKYRKSNAIEMQQYKKMNGVAKCSDRTCVHISVSSDSASHSETAKSISKSNSPSEVTVPKKKQTLRVNIKNAGLRATKAKLKTVKLTMLIIICFIICSAPFICVQLWNVWDADAHTSSFYTSAPFTIIALLASLNSVANPWIYIIFYDPMRNIFCRKRKKLTSSPPFRKKNFEEEFLDAAKQPANVPPQQREARINRSGNFRCFTTLELNDQSFN